MGAVGKKNNVPNHVPKAHSGSDLMAAFQESVERIEEEKKKKQKPDKQKDS